MCFRCPNHTVFSSQPHDFPILSPWPANAHSPFSLSSAIRSFASRKMSYTRQDLVTCPLGFPTHSILCWSYLFICLVPLIDP